MSDAVLLAGAEIEFHEAYARLAGSGFGRADRFDHLVQEGLRQLAGFPRSGPEYIAPYRRLVLREFPYALYYALEGRRVLVHALLDLRQNPDSVRRRLGI